MDRMGGSVKRLTDRGHDPAWTPDGRFVIYSTDGVTDPDGRNAVSEGWKVDVETRQATKLTAGDFIQPAVSPHQQRIAYWALPVSSDAPLRITGGNRDIWTMRMDGSQTVRVTDRSFAMNWSPVWSRDGRFLFFASDRGGSMNLWRVAIDEASGKALGQPEAITTPSPWIGLLALSGDGHRLAYAAYDFTCNVARVPFDPVQEKVVGPPEAITTGTLCWNQPDPSPDGTRVVFSSYHRQEDLYLARVDASGVWKTTQLTNDTAKDRAPRWSPDGKQIAYYSNRGDEYALWTIDPDGSHARPRVAMPGAAPLFPLWSPDGLRFVSADLDAKLNYVFALNDTVASAPVETLPHLPDAKMSFNSRSWSTDGRRIAGSAGGSVWVYSFDTKAFTPVTPGGQPTWLADGKRLVYSDRGRLRLVDAATKQGHEIHATAGESLLFPTLTKDNRFLYYLQATAGADIWVMTIK
jgi:tricorn protease